MSKTNNTEWTSSYGGMPSNDGRLADNELEAVTLTVDELEYCVGGLPGKRSPPTVTLGGSPPSGTPSPTEVWNNLLNQYGYA